MFEIKSENAHGIFHVKLHRLVSTTEIMQLAAMAANVLPEIPAPVYTTVEQSPESIVANSGSLQSKLGERPVNQIVLGSYVEPDVGFRIKMLSFPETAEKRTKSVKMFRAITGLPLVASKEIIWGNHRCVILTREHAMLVMEEFKKLEIYATIMEGQCRIEVEG